MIKMKRAKKRGIGNVATKAPAKPKVAKSVARKPSKQGSSGSDVPSGRGIAIKQPYVEQILRGTKTTEWRSRPTNIRGRVYLYASMGPGADSAWKSIKQEPGDLPVGVIVGSVEIVDCKYDEPSGDYGYKLKKPKRYKKYLTPKKRAQPCWFFPFGNPSK